MARESKNFELSKKRSPMVERGFDPEGILEIVFSSSEVEVKQGVGFERLDWKLGSWVV